ncbi:response regulator transcription factor [Sphaerothrix gracilis]|uniref:response regulator transcription factor n=1 Tax=Sphaerothrix gracilis TaxID=3151835 RepID=UPI0031FCB10B
MKTVLIIEDEAQTRNIFLKCLKFEGFQAFSAENGADGIAMAQKCWPDLIVCDIMMPDMDGYSVLSKLRRSQQTAAIPLIFLTAKVTMSDLRKGMELGADDYLTKPCTIEQFLLAISTRLKRHEELQRSSSARKGASISQSQSFEPASKPESIFPECPQLTHVFQFIEAHYRDVINLSDIAQAAGYSPAYLTTLVQEKTGRTIKQWVIERRMAQAKTLLKSSKKSIRQVAEASGYSDPSYFTRQFRQFHGLSPQNWRKNFVAKLTD